MPKLLVTYGIHDSILTLQNLHVVDFMDVFGKDTSRAPMHVARQPPLGCRKETKPTLSSMDLWIV